MLEKLFARLRSWRQGDIGQQLGHQAAAPLLPTSAQNGLSTLAGPLTPPPLPADAWAEAESESGIVITDSGIIILGPDAEPLSGPATPSLPPAPPSAISSDRKLTPGELDWDDVLDRARARAQESVEKALPAKPPAPARAPQAPAPGRPATARPAAEKPASGKPAMLPATARPATEKPVAAKPATEKPVVDKPAVEKPAKAERANAETRSGRSNGQAQPHGSRSRRRRK